MKIRNTATIFMISALALQSCSKQTTETAAITDSLIADSPAIESPQVTPVDSLSSIDKALLPGQKQVTVTMFSSLKNADIDVSKDAVTLNSVTDGSTEKAYLLFNEDQSKAEIWMPTEPKSIIFARKGTEGNYTWTDGKLEMIQWKGYVLRTLKQGTPLFGGDSM